MCFEEVNGLNKGVRVSSLCNFSSKNRKGQVTLFIILALVIVAGIAAYFLLSGTLAPTTQIPEEFQPVYNAYTTCLQDALRSGISVLEGQGGYIYLPDFEPGSKGGREI